MPAPPPRPTAAPRAASDEPDHRVRCLRCFRPEAQCLCPHLARVENSTEVLVLQHPKERRHAFNTARLTRLSLARADLVSRYTQELARDPSLPARLEGAGLLYPGPGARDLSTLRPDERPDRLVVLDGTWYHARNMLRDVAALQALPRFTLPGGLTSGFRIRKQPDEHCLSTIEAVHAALTCLEPDAAGLDDLLRPFHEMQRTHLASSTVSAPRHRLRPRPRRLRLPATLTDEFDSLVLVYVEMTPWIPQGEERGMVAFAARRPATGEGLRCALEGADEVAPRWPAMGLEQELARGVPWPLERLRREWRSFLRPGDSVAAWNATALGVLTRLLGPPPRPLDLREVYRAHRPHRGSLDEIVAAEGLGVDPAGRSRAAVRLANAARIVELLRQRDAARGV